MSTSDLDYKPVDIISMSFIVTINFIEINDIINYVDHLSVFLRCANKKYVGTYVVIAIYQKKQIPSKHIARLRTKLLGINN